LFAANQQVVDPPSQQTSRDRTAPTFGGVGTQYVAHT